MKDAARRVVAAVLFSVFCSDILKPTVLIKSRVARPSTPLGQQPERGRVGSGYVVLWDPVQYFNSASDSLYVIKACINIETNREEAETIRDRNMQTIMCLKLS